MKLDEFRKRVFEQFGSDLDHATPANVREFLDQMNLAAFRKRGAHKPLVLNEAGRTYEEIVKDTFARLLTLPAEDSVPLLWIIAFELSFSVVEYQYAEALGRLFDGLDDIPPKG